MVDVEDRDGIDLIVDRVEDSVGAAASAESPTQLAFQRLAHSSWTGREVTVDELDNRRDDARRDELEVALGGRGEGDRVGQRDRFGTLNS